MPSRPVHSEERVETLRAQIAYAERVKQLMNHLHAAENLDQILVSMQDEILSVFDAEHLTIYAIDYEKRQLYSRFLDLDQVQEIRVPLNEQSIAGFVARTKRTVNLADAYDKAELSRTHPTLSFDDSWDQKTGVRTKQVLTVPICGPRATITGVLQLLNTKSADSFTREDENKVKDIAHTLGIALHNQYQLVKLQPQKFDALLAARLLSPPQLSAAQAIAAETQRPIEAILRERYHISKQDLGHSLSMFYSCPFLEADEHLVINADLVKDMNVNYLKTNYWLPLQATQDTIDILTDDPHSLQQKRDIQRLFKQRNIRYRVGLREDILPIVNAIVSERDPQARKDSLQAILGQLASESKVSSHAPTDQLFDESDSGIVRLVSQMIADAYQQGASDIHLEPYGEDKQTLIRFRVDGRCHDYLTVDPPYRRPLASRLKVMANLDISERRKPQDGKIKFRLPDREIELRVATIPTAGNENEDVALRVLAASESLPLEAIQMTASNLDAFRTILEKPYGLILCVGPTGSGKTTTLHSALGHINTPDKKIWTAEDPVEITQYGLRQVQIHPKIGFTFAAAMRAFLRADPDIIMVGEIRDQETAQIGIEASLTGHLILSTVHTNSAVETITRLIEMGMDPFHFADALLGILAQRLTRTICQACKEPYHPSREEYQALAAGYGEEAFAQLDIPYDDDLRLYRGRGCEVCQQTGYKGRMGIHELLITTDEIKSRIHTRATVAELRQVARAQGMTTLVQDGISKVLQGWTDYSQIKAVAIR